MPPQFQIPVENPVVALNERDSTLSRNFVACTEAAVAGVVVVSAQLR